MIKFGGHFPIEGNSFVPTLKWTERYGCNALQVFVHTPYQYFIPKADVWNADDMKEFKEKTKDMDVVVHSCFLINLCSPKPNIRGVSRKSLIHDAKLAVELGAKYLVFHAGSYTKESTLEQGLAYLKEGLIYILKEVPGIELLMENTAGRGTAVGHDISNLRNVIDELPEPYRSRVGICLDVAHAWGAGYNMAGLETASEFLCMNVVDYIKVVHFNMPDKGVAMGSGLDRHRCSMDNGEFEMGYMNTLLSLFQDKVIIMERPFDKEEQKLDTTIMDKDFAQLKEWINARTTDQPATNPT